MSSRSFGELSRKLNHYGAGLNKANREAVEGIAKDVKRFAMVRLGSPTGRAVRLRNVGKKGARIGVSYNVKEYPTNVTALVRAYGPFHLVENKIEPHQIPRVYAARYKKLESGKRSSKRELTGKMTRDQGKRMLAFPSVVGRSGFRRGPIQHPGVRSPKRPFQTGVTLANRAAGARIDTSLNKALRKAF